MAGLFDEWDEKRERATRPVESRPAPAAPVDLDRAQRYARAALEGEVRNIQAVPIGSGRNDQLNKSGMKMGHYIAAGAIDERTVYEVLGAADGGLDYPATLKTLRSSIEAGKAVPAIIPEGTPSGPARHNPAPWEPGYVAPSDDPFDENYAGPVKGAAVVAAQPADGGAVAAVSAPDADDAAWQALVVMEARTQRLRRDARSLLDAEDAVRDFREPPYLPTLADELALPDEDVTYAVDELFPSATNVLLTAQYKTGKTTMMLNLVRSFVDAEPFLGRFPVADPGGRVALFNYEVDRAQFRRWMRDAGIANPERVAVLNLRGYRLPLGVPQIETWVVEWLKRAEAAVWIVDPFARAAVGVDENSNTEVGVWLDTLDVIKERSGVSELVLPTHTGRGEQEQGDERARGATRLDDWADVRWLLTKNADDDRFFRATGRDVEVSEGGLTFDPATRLLTMSGEDRRTVDERRYREAVLTILTNNAGAGTVELIAGVRQILGKASDTKIKGAIKVLIERGDIHTRRESHAVRHYLGRGAGNADPDAFDP